MSVELPIYTCMELMRAGRIDSLLSEERGLSLRIKSPTWTGSVIVSAEWAKKHRPEIGGYYVVCEGGLGAYVSAEAFEMIFRRVTSPVFSQVAS